MKLSHKILLSLAIGTAAGILIYATRNSNTKRMLARVADEGYETAQDILFPGKGIPEKHLHYGPVIPE